MTFETLRRSKLLHLLLLLALALMVLASAGGCGGSSHHSSSSKEETETDDDSDSDSDSDTDTDTDTDTDDGDGSTPTATFSKNSDGSYKVVLSSTANASSLTTAATEDVEVFNYVWHISPSVSSDYYTLGDSSTILTEAQVLAAIAKADDDFSEHGMYIARDIRYIPSSLTFDMSTNVQTDATSEPEYAAYYSDSVLAEAQAANPDVTYQKLILATIRNSNMAHSASDAYNNPVLHITKPGTYHISGNWKGQIRVQGDGTSSAKFKLIFDGVKVTCSVAPAVVFEDVYECGPDDQETITASNRFLTVGKNDVTSSTAGAVVELTSGTTNTFTGTNVFKIFTVQPKNSSTTTVNGIDTQKRLLRMDGAFYSFQSMEIHGSGTMNLNSSFEGLDTEMHLAINDATINIVASDDGINTNEDYVSVFAINSGNLTVSSTGGDAIDSNGWLVINGGKVTVTSTSGGDNGMDSDMGVYISDSATGSASSVDNLKTDISGYTAANFDTGTSGGGELPSDDNGPGGEPPTKDGHGGEAPAATNAK